MEIRSWCCKWMKDTGQDDGERGFYLSVEQLDSSLPHEDGRLLLYVALIFRSVSVENFGELSTEAAITLETKLPTRFCPFCGEDLLEFYSV